VSPYKIDIPGDRSILPVSAAALSRRWRGPQYADSDREDIMVRLGGAASPTYVSIFRGLQAHFLRHGIELDWVIYSNYDALVEAFARREIDLAWNAPLAYVKTKRRLQGACQVVAMRDVDVNFTTHFIANADSVIAVVQDLKGKRVALGSRGSMQAGLLPYYFLQQLGLDPAHDLALCSFYDERQGDAGSDERDVVERVGRREYDAGAVSGRTVEALKAEGELTSGDFRIIWSSPGYSHCCFTAHSDLDPGLIEKIAQAFVAIDAHDPAGKAVLEGEGCKAFVPGITTGWETLEKAAEEAGML
jgi:phosphate/phosphite/phosphonate ABC transporter binding protein